MKWRARQVIRSKISYHERVRRNLIYCARQRVYDGYISYERFAEGNDEIWKEAAWHYRYAERLKQLLKKYL